MSKEQKINRKDILPQLEQIKAKTEELSTLVEALPDCYVKNSYKNSVKNLETKNTNFLTIGGPRKGLTDEEKEVLKALRSGKKVQILEVPTVDGNTTDGNENLPSKKGRKNH